MIKWNNLFSSLFHKMYVGYTLDIETTVIFNIDTQEGLTLYTERFLNGSGKGKVSPLYGLGRAAGKSGLAMAELGKAFGKLKGRINCG